MRDLDDFIRQIVDRDGVAVQDIAIVAQSVGAVVASAWVHDYAPKIRAMILAAPAFEVNLFVPGARTGLEIWHKLRGDYTVQSYVQPSMLTQDDDRALTYTTDPLIARSISANVLLDLYRTADRIVADAPAITVPTQVVWGDSDPVFPPPYGEALAARIPGAQLHMIQACGHLPQVEHPAHLSDLITAFSEGDAA